MGEEKPSVPWVLEDYETSQVGKISIEHKFSETNLKEALGLQINKQT